MTKPKRAQTAVYADHEVITPPSDLKEHAHYMPGEGLDEDALERAAQALSSLEGEFTTWMQSEADCLVASRKQIEDGGLTVEKLERLYRAAHDIRGQGATFGFPLAGDIADNLCNYVDAVAAPLDVSLEFIDAHIDAISAVLREDVRDRADPTARAVLWGLNEARKRFTPHIEPVTRTVDIQP